MKKTKRLFGIVLSLLIVCASLCVISPAAIAQGDENGAVIGMVNSAVPYIQVEVKRDDLDESQISAQIQSKDVEIAGFSDSNKVKSLTIILFDTSTSMISSFCPEGAFDELKNATAELVKTKTDNNHHFDFYTFGDKDKTLEYGEATDAASAEELAGKIRSIEAKDDSTALNDVLLKVFSIANEKRAQYDIVKILLVTDSHGEDGVQRSDLTIDSAEAEYQYNRVPIFILCNRNRDDGKSNSDAAANARTNNYQKLNSFAAESGGKGTDFDFSKKENASSVLKSFYEDEMFSSTVITIIADIPVDKTTRKLTVNINGSDYTENVLLDRAANINAPIEAEVEVNENNTAFIISFTQEGFSSNVPLNKAASDNNSYEIRPSSGGKKLVVQKVEKNEDNSYTVQVRGDIYTDEYDFSFPGIEDLSANKNTVKDLENVKIEAKSKFWIVFPYLMIALAVIVVLLAFYLILLHLKKKKNVRTIKELFETQVNETVEEKHYIQNVNKPAGGKVDMYFKTSSNPQRHITVNISSSIIVGRSNMCEVLIDDPKLSRQHFAIEYTDGVYMISDLNSSNGTYVNGIRVQSRQRLNSGDMISAGLTSVRIEF